MTKQELQDSPKAEIDQPGGPTDLPPSTPKVCDHNTDAPRPQPTDHKLCPKPKRNTSERKLGHNNQSTQNSPAMIRFLAESDSPWTVFGQTGYPMAEAPPYFGSTTTTAMATHVSSSDQGDESYPVPGGGNGKVGSEVESVFCCDGSQIEEDETRARK